MPDNISATIYHKKPRQEWEYTGATTIDDVCHWHVPSWLQLTRENYAVFNSTRRRDIHPCQDIEAPFNHHGRHDLCNGCVPVAMRQKIIVLTQRAMRSKGPSTRPREQSKKQSLSPPLLSSISLARRVASFLSFLATKQKPHSLSSPTVLPRSDTTRNVFLEEK